MSTYARNVKSSCPEGEDGSSAQPERHDAGRVHCGGLQEYVDKKSAMEIGDRAVIQKKKSSELPRRDMEGSEVQKIGKQRV